MNGIPYRDTIAARGSNLYNALMAGDLKLAANIYRQTSERMYSLVKEQKEKFEDVPL